MRAFSGNGAADGTLSSFHRDEPVCRRITGRGFTLVELTVVLPIAGIPPGIDFPTFKQHARSETAYRHQRGFGLIESVVTLLIVSFGLLALAYMQSWGQRYGQDAGARTQATMIATELMDRIRITGTPAPSAAAVGYTEDPSDPNSVTCNPVTASVANDRDCFYFQIGERLPAGAAAIDVNGNMYRITIAWVDRFADRFDANDDGLTDVECTSNGRLWYQDGNLTWYPENRKPSEPACLVAQTWSMVQ